MLHRTTRQALAASAFLLAAAPFAAAQGETGFLRGQGRSDVVLSYTLDWYDEFWVGDDKVEDPGVGEVERASYTLYAAYGLDAETDLFLSASYVEAEAARVMAEAEITIRVDLGRGVAVETVWTCDFSYDYVRINAEYRS